MLLALAAVVLLGCGSARADEVQEASPLQNSSIAGF